MDIEKNKKILIIGASGDLGFDLLKGLSDSAVTIGVHCFHNKSRLEKFIEKPHAAKIKIFSGDVSSQGSSQKIIDAFVKWAGGIDHLIQLSGAVQKPEDWKTLTQEQWDRDIAVNLTGPYFLAQQAMNHMLKHGGKVIFTSTASAAHGGGGNSMAYGAAKAGIECITKGLARQGAPYNILVNAVAPGFIMTKFHTDQMKRTREDLKKRGDLVPLKRAGEAKDVTGIITYLLSKSGDFVTGQVIAVSGGDWL